MKKFRVLDLFSGIGGFSLGLERTGGFETVAFCEIEEFPRKILAKHWPEVPIYHDVKELTKARLVADGITGIEVITGGFPCQDLSVAGHQRGIGEETRSGLWSDCQRLLGELRPKIAIFENVSNLLAGPSEQPGGWFSTVLSDLAKIGFDAVWCDIPASRVGAEHARRRVWIVTYPNEVRWDVLAQVLNKNSTENAAQTGENKTPLANSSSEWLLNHGDLRDLREINGLSEGVDRIGACGNAVHTQIPEMIGYAILEAEKLKPNEAKK